MRKDNAILLGKAEDKDVLINPAQLNRHGLITGASGTGKTVTLKVIAESLSELGVPSIIADVKGDLTGMINPGDQNKIHSRVDSMGLQGFACQSFPVSLFDVYGERGVPVRMAMETFDPLFLCRIFDLTEAQEGNLSIIFQMAADMKLDLIDLKDLQAMISYASDHLDELSSTYGHLTKASLGTIQRKLLQFEQQGGSRLFGLPEIDMNDLMRKENDKGVISLLECQDVFHQPQLYAMFLLSLLNRLFVELPEAGDQALPKAVFFFDEAHLLFDDAPKSLVNQVIQIVKLIRSKGIGVFFCSQNPADIPEEVLAQLGCRIQHALRAYTPAETKKIKAAADSFRPNPAFDTQEAIMNLETGWALVSVLDEKGAPTVVEKTQICPPESSMDAADEAKCRLFFKGSALYEKYGKEVDPESAFELIQKENEEAEAAEKVEKEEAEKKKQEEKAARERMRNASRFARKVQNRAENEVINIGIRSARKFLKYLLK